MSEESESTANVLSELERQLQRAVASVQQLVEIERGGRRLVDQEGTLTTLRDLCDSVSEVNEAIEAIEWEEEEEQQDDEAARAREKASQVIAQSCHRGAKARRQEAWQEHVAAKRASRSIGNASNGRGRR